MIFYSQSSVYPPSSPPPSSARITITHTTLDTIINHLRPHLRPAPYPHLCIGVIIPRIVSTKTHSRKLYPTSLTESAVAESNNFSNTSLGPVLPGRPARPRKRNPVPLTHEPGPTEARGVRSTIVRKAGWERELAGGMRRQSRCVGGGRREVEESRGFLACMVWPRGRQGWR